MLLFSFCERIQNTRDRYYYLRLVRFILSRYVAKYYYLDIIDAFRSLMDHKTLSVHFKGGISKLGNLLEIW